MFAGRMFTLKGSTVSDLPDFEFSINGARRWLKTKRFQAAQAKYGWEYGVPPPRLTRVVRWCEEEDAEALALCERFLLMGHLETDTFQPRRGHC